MIKKRSHNLPRVCICVPNSTGLCSICRERRGIDSPILPSKPRTAMLLRDVVNETKYPRHLKGVDVFDSVEEYERHTKPVPHPKISSPITDLRPYDPDEPPTPKKLAIPSELMLPHQTFRKRYADSRLPREVEIFIEKAYNSSEWPVRTHGPAAPDPYCNMILYLGLNRKVVDGKGQYCTIYLENPSTFYHYIDNDKRNGERIVHKPFTSSLYAVHERWWSHAKRMDPAGCQCHSHPPCSFCAERWTDYIDWSYELYNFGLVPPAEFTYYRAAGLA